MKYLVISKEERLRNLNIEMEISHYVRNDRKTLEMTQDIKKPPETLQAVFFIYESELFNILYFFLFFGS